MSATQMLVAEHDQILRCLELLEVLCLRLDDGPNAPEQAAGTVVRFLQEFADGLHHKKEEGTLFPTMGSAGMPRHGGPIAVMLSEHDEGREYVGAMAESVKRLGDETSRNNFTRAARSFVDLLRNHISKENQILFPMAESMLPPAMAAEVASIFAKHREIEAEAYARGAADLEALETMLG